MVRPMLPEWSSAWRVALLSAVSALVGAGTLTVFYASRATLAIEFDEGAPPFTSGFHPAERASEVTFAWTGPRAVVRLAGADRGRDWTCATRLRGARADGVEQPTVTVAVEETSASMRVTNEFSEVSLLVPARTAASGLTFSIVSQPTFVPGPGDRRELGVQVDRLSCAPAGWARPPRASLVAASAIGALFAASAGLLGLGVLVTIAVVAFVSVGHAWLLASGGGAFGDYPDQVLAIGIGAVVAVLAIVASAGRLGRRALEVEARLATVAAGAIGAIVLSALTHPAKSLVDAVFQAHRLEWVMEGRYFFTQPLPDGVSFPYAIGLYLAAWPFASLVTDHVLLLRAVVVGAHALSTLALYPVVARAWADRRAALAAVLLSWTIPLTFIVWGNANLPNAFGQSVALGVMSAFVAVAGDRVRVVALLGVTILASVALVAHVSTLALLLGMAGASLVALFVARPPERRSTVALAFSLAVALAVVVALYYRHFPEVYERALTRVGASASPASDMAIVAPRNDPGSQALVRPLTFVERVSGTAQETAANLGWPLIALASVGAVAMARAGLADRLSVVLVGWAIAWLACLGVGTATPVDVAYQRYALEFIGRVNLAGFPVAVLLAARAVGWAWSGAVSAPVRWVVSLLALAALSGGVASLVAWL
jgi:hypothetical protein